MRPFQTCSNISYYMLHFCSIPSFGGGTIVPKLLNKHMQIKVLRWVLEPHGLAQFMRLFHKGLYLEKWSRGSLS